MTVFYFAHMGIIVIQMRMSRAALRIIPGKGLVVMLNPGELSRDFRDLPLLG
jgi:hypothetical protein